MLKVSELDRIFSKIELNNCWLWRASLDSKGYAQVNIRGKIKRVHRVIYEQFKGDIPKDLDIDHLCRIRSCVNPDHLEAVSRSVNLLRGVLHNSLKTKCPRNHLYDMTDSRGRRRCKQCLREKARIRSKRYYWRHKNAQSVSHNG